MPIEDPKEKKGIKAYQNKNKQNTKESKGRKRQKKELQNDTSKFFSINKYFNCK